MVSIKQGLDLACKKELLSSITCYIRKKFERNMDKFASTFFKKPKTSPRSRSSAGNSAGSPVRTASSISTGAQYPGLPATELPSNYAPTRTGSEVSLPPGYEYVMQNEPQSLFLQDQVEEQGCYHRVAFTFMVRLRIAPTTNQPLEAIFA